MLENPPAGMPRITPYIYYSDMVKAIAWLTKAFGFRKKLILPIPGGKAMHAEMEIKNGVIMLGPNDMDNNNLSPGVLKGRSQSLYVYIDDIYGHFKNAKAAGAKIIAEPSDMIWGDMTYSAFDLEDHLWTFAEHVRDVAPEDLIRFRK
ncbi:MAG: VOC family protein [Proteobacteria bacterium]|nr:VOC family protein [Pseudomonadota bacterium]MBU1715717.1 VOC family protein [Pseudomonadota bacterium]